MSEVPLCQDSGVTLGVFLISEVPQTGFGRDAAAQPPDGRGHRAGPRLGGLASGYDPSSSLLSLQVLEGPEALS